MSRVQFSTSGWRGILGEEFTFDRVKVITQAIADHLLARGEADRGVVIGHDARFMGRDFAHETARVLAAAGIRSYLCKGPCPTPAIVSAMLLRKAAGAFNFTASHNPHQYNGIKYYSSWGGAGLTGRDP